MKENICWHTFFLKSFIEIYMNIFMEEYDEFKLP